LDLPQSWSKDQLEYEAMETGTPGSENKIKYWVKRKKYNKEI